MKSFFRLGILLSMILWLGCPVVDPLKGVDYPVEKGDVLFYPITNKLSPPVDFQVDVSGRNPVLKWIPNHKADYYRIYRKQTDAQRFIVVDYANCVRGETFVDVTIDKTVHSDTYEYRISSVDRFDREGFLSNPVIAIISSPVFTETATIADASDGFFNSVVFGGKTIVQQNKIGILLKIKKPAKYQMGVNDPVAFRVLRRRTAVGDWAVLIPRFEPALSDAYPDPKVGGDVFYYVDVPPTQGEEYSYKIVPINPIGKLGTESSATGGYVYGIPKIRAANSFAVSGQKPGAVQFDLDLPEFLEYVNIWVSKTEGGPYARVASRVKVDRSKSQLETPVLSSAIFTAAGEPSAQSGNYYFCVRGSYGLFGGGGGGELFETIDSSVYPASAYAETLSIMPNPVLNVTNGKRDPETGSIVSKISLTWQKATGGSVTHYNIYRTRRLNWVDGEHDNTAWGSAVGTVSVGSSSSSTLSWVDEGSNMSYGAYFYKVNPVATSLEQQNDDTLVSFAQATMMLSKPLAVKATEREHADKVVLSWPELSGGEDETLLYRIEGKNQVLPDWPVAPALQTVPVESGMHTIIWQTAYIGLIDFRVTPVAVFKNGQTVLKSEDAVDAPILPVSGAREISDIEWTKLVMESIYEAQAKITPDQRKKADWNSGGIAYDLTFLQYKRRSYYKPFASETTEKYDAYRFINCPGINGAVTIADGAIYHAFCKQNNTSEVVYISFSSNVFSLNHGSGDDGIPKTQGELDIQGLYPGKIQLWYENEGYEHRNDEYNVKPVNDYKPDRFYTSAHSGWINWLNNSYGLKIKEDEQPSINKTTAYAIRRDGAVSYQNIHYSEVGAIK